ncbi:hypothetical protein LMG23994_01686 [Cupriavidus pinatubonensis]|uniref:Uncharacterized protein n=1 Tax=Cupriavidus pinatubonensis TaxID=248026 RepID=A0ABN7Y8X6_9BURK|nr:hypothetical protein LMG23994_01686 [Cupriavidus pinatubonensis]
MAARWPHGSGWTPGQYSSVVARAVVANLGDKQDRFSRWVRNLIERRGYWRTAIAIAAKNVSMAWAALKYEMTSSRSLLLDKAKL